ncbi:hypothetical protein PINS_up003398 [Pythium insidiosum]|nr:hypothetical protein PINS_up003398 [Pythium insidiosum]
MNMVAIELPGQRDDMTFVLGDRRLQQISLRRRPSSSAPLLLFKVQSTSSRRFRVRPTLGVLSSATEELTTIQIQLSPGESEPCECKFLIVVRQCARDDASIAADLASDDASRIKEQWKRAESRDYESLVVSKTITARIVATAAQEQETPTDNGATTSGMHHQSTVAAPETSTLVELTLPQSAVTWTPTCAVSKQLPIETVEQRAQVVLLMMKNRSQRPRNRLNLEELSQLQALQDHDPAHWVALDDMARRLRQLLRAHRRGGRT